jgi:hypothetical protein
MKQLEIKDIGIEIVCEPEESAIYGNCQATDDDVADRRAADAIKRQLRNGNQWAWCTVRVKCDYRGLESSSYLGCCSYKSENDFKASDYYADMVAECLAELQSKLENLLAD